MFSCQVFFIFLQGRGRVARVAVGWQIKRSNGSRLGRAVQTTARQAEWALECLSSCRVHSTQWKATHLVTGLRGRGVPTLTLLSRCNRVTKTEGVRTGLIGVQKRNGGKSRRVSEVSGRPAVWFCWRNQSLQGWSCYIPQVHQIWLSAQAISMPDLYQYH